MPSGCTFSTINAAQSCAVHAASLVELGHEVVGIDVDERKIAALCQGRAPFYEPGFEDMTRRVPDISRIRELIGWEPKHSIDDIITDVIEHERWLQVEGAAR